MLCGRRNVKVYGRKRKDFVKKRNSFNGDLMKLLLLLPTLCVGGQREFLNFFIEELRFDIKGKLIYSSW